MNNIEIRRRILEKLYNAEQKKPDNIIPSDKLCQELGISNEDIGSNIKYLHQKHFIEAHQLATRHYSALLNITHDGIDIIEDENEFNRKFPIKITNIQNSNGVVIDSNNVRVDINQSINIQNSFNKLYEECEAKDGSEEIISRIKAIENEIGKDTVNTDKIKESTNWLNRNASWTIFPII